MTITWTTFVIRLLVGFLLAVGIGIERQWLKTREVLKINVLVTLGSAMFVMLSIMTPGDSSPTRISAQIVSGVGFLGGGVILREGASVRGINTAATLWCTAAIGTLVGSGYLVQAYSATLVVVGANLLLRPLVETFKYQRDQENRESNSSNLQNKVEPVKSQAVFPISNELISLSSAQSSLQKNNVDSIQEYTCQIICPLERESQVLELLTKFAREHQLTLISMESKNMLSEKVAEELQVALQIQFVHQGDRLGLQESEKMIKLLKSEAQVSSVNWKLYVD